MRAPRREPPPDRGPARAKGSRRLLARLGYGVAVLAVWGAVAAGVAIAYFAYDLPDVETALHPERRPTVTILARDGSEIASIGDSYGQPVSLSEVSPALVRAVLATEDRRFYSHFGLDPIGLARAMVANLRAGRIVQGGSTITQQLAKNLYLSSSRDPFRKLRELVIARRLEAALSKRRIFEIYLNVIEWGDGIWGAEAAARTYFGIPASALNAEQAALLAGAIINPRLHSPARPTTRLLQRQRIILGRMGAVRPPAPEAVVTPEQFPAEEALQQVEIVAHPYVVPGEEEMPAGERAPAADDVPGEAAPPSVLPGTGLVPTPAPFPSPPPVATDDSAPAS